MTDVVKDPKKVVSRFYAQITHDHALTAGEVGRAIAAGGLGHSVVGKVSWPSLVVDPGDTVERFEFEELSPLDPVISAAEAGELVETTFWIKIRSLQPVDSATVCSKLNDSSYASVKVIEQSAPEFSEKTLVLTVQEIADMIGGWGALPEGEAEAIDTIEGYVEHMRAGGFNTGREI